MKMELIEGTETSAIRTQTLGNYPKENILHTEHGESLKSRHFILIIPKIRDKRKMQIEQKCVVNFHIPLSLETAVVALGVRCFEMNL